MKNPNLSFDPNNEKKVSSIIVPNMMVVHDIYVIEWFKCHDQFYDNTDIEKIQIQLDPRLSGAFSIIEIY